MCRCNGADAIKEVVWGGACAENYYGDCGTATTGYCRECRWSWFADDEGAY